MWSGMTNMSDDSDKPTIPKSPAGEEPTVLVDPTSSPTVPHSSQPEEATVPRPTDPDATVPVDRTAAAALDSQIPADPTDPLVGQLLLSRYRIVKRIGKGGFGSVYRAVDELKKEGGEEHEIAIKTLDLDVSGTRLSGLIQEVSHLAGKAGSAGEYDCID